MEMEQPTVIPSCKKPLLHHKQLPLPSIIGEGQSIIISNKIAWLHDQILGNGLEYESPFGKRRMTYADSTASGRCLRFIEDYIMNNVLPFYGNTHTCDSFLGSETTRISQEATEYIKACLGATDNEVMLFCGSGTTAAIKRLQEVMGIAIPSLLKERILNSSVLTDQERWVVFTGPYEHHSNCLSWRQSLAEVVEIGLDPDGCVDMAVLEAQLEAYQTTIRPMLGSFSACSNVTGVCSNTRAIARLLHQFGAFACFDFAASGPYVEIKMRSGEMDGYDAVFIGTHKFIGGPSSPGILVMNKALYKLGNSPPSTCGGGTVDFVNGYTEEDTLYVQNIEGREDAGTPPIIQKTRAALAFWVKEYIGYQVIECREKYYIQRAMKRLFANPNIWVLGDDMHNASIDRQAILSFLIHTSTDAYPGNIKGEKNELQPNLDLWAVNSGKRSKPLHGSFTAKLLNDLFGIQARGGCACAGPYAHRLLNITHSHSLALKSYVQKGYLGVKPGWARVSFPYYMSNVEFEYILLALEFIATFGQRFLHLYQFNWRTGIWSFDNDTLRKILSPGKELNGTGTHNYDVGDQDCPFSSLKSGLSSVKTLDQSTEDVSDNFEVDVATIEAYTSYLRCARRAASLLPKYPPRRLVPKDIDSDHLLFYV